jgi:hypothetical protein
MRTEGRNAKLVGELLSTFWWAGTAIKEKGKVRSEKGKNSAFQP